MEYVVVCLVAVFASALTLFSGFGLGTVLLPAFALFFPVPVAVAATAVVHFANNIFKIALVGRRADWGVVARFAIPGAVAAVLGAWLLASVSAIAPLGSYSIGQSQHEVTAVKLVVGSAITLFAILELTPRFAGLSVGRKYLPVGGVLSGFFGGLSGNQGALRSMFLIKTGLGTEGYVGTSTVSAVIVDLARLPVYGVALVGLGVADLSGSWGLVAAASAAAFAGAWLGSRYLKKVTMRAIQVVVAVLLIVVGVGMATGLL